MYQQITDAVTGQPSTSTVRRISDGAFIPINDDGNVDCQFYKLWISAGNTPDPAPPVDDTPPPTPMEVLATILLDKAIITQSDIDAAEQESGTTLFQSSDVKGP